MSIGASTKGWRARVRLASISHSSKQSFLPTAIVFTARHQLNTVKLSYVAFRHASGVAPVAFLNIRVN